jgi:hypothetical protein
MGMCPYNTLVKHTFLAGTYNTCISKPSLPLLAIEMYVPGVQVMHSASHPMRPARKHGYLDFSSSMNLHLVFGIILFRQY